MHVGSATASGGVGGEIRTHLANDPVLQTCPALQLGRTHTV